MTLEQTEYVEPSPAFQTGDYVTCESYRGVALIVRDLETVWVDYLNESDGEEWEGSEQVWNGRYVVTMVGDNRRFSVEESELTTIDRDAFCVDCGQTGCDWGRESND
jgi:hypothetical protein